MPPENGGKAAPSGDATLGRTALLALAASLWVTGPSLTTRPLEWADLPPPIQQRLAAAGISAGRFAAFRDAHDRETRERVREGDLDAIVYYALQSTTFTSAPPIEPALSARGFVERLDAGTRRQYLAGMPIGSAGVPEAARQRLLALAAASPTPREPRRLAYIREILDREAPASSARPAFVLEQYVRAMRFLYQKEFGLAGSANPATTVAALYQARGLSTDTAIEAGYLVHTGLAVLRALEPGRRIRRVLIIGPGLDLAPRTGLIDAAPADSYQPYAVIDALVSLGLARLDDLTVVGADVNARVVDRLAAAASTTAAIDLTLVSGIGAGGGIAFDEDYRRYFEALGTAIATPLGPPALPGAMAGHLRKGLRVRPDVAQRLHGVRLDIATGRLAGEPFDLAIATNVLPYLDDEALAVAMANLAGMLAPGGVLLHNEAREVLADLSAEVALPFVQARAAPIARVEGAPPLADRVFLHEKPAR